MGAAVYIFGVIVTLTCAILLTRGYSQSRKRLLLWSAVCFYGLALSNILVFLDLVVLPDVDLYVWRLITAALSMVVLIYGLIWEGEK